jgi:hypothetical protein
MTTLLVDQRNEVKSKNSKNFLFKSAQETARNIMKNKRRFLKFKVIKWLTFPDNPVYIAALQMTN